MLLAARLGVLSPTLCAPPRISSGIGWSLSLVVYAVRQNGPETLLAWWWLMLVATMPLFIADLLLHGWQRSLPHRRNVVISLIVVGYLLVWTATGFLVVPCLLLLSVFGTWMPAIGLVVAAVWWQAPLRRTFSRKSHRRPPLRVFGLPVALDALMAGLQRGLWCTFSCAPLMLAALLLPVPHEFGMLVVGVLALAERSGFLRR